MDNRRSVGSAISRPMTTDPRCRRSRARLRSPATTATCGASIPTTTRSRSSTSPRTATRRSPRSRWPRAVVRGSHTRRPQGLRDQMASGTVSVIDAYAWKVVDTIKVGTEPFGCALTPDGRQLYVANQSSGTVSVINTRRDRVIDTIYNVGAKPHSLAITADGKQGLRDPVSRAAASRRSAAADPERRRRRWARGPRDGDRRVLQHGGRHRRAQSDPNAGFNSDGNTLAREPLDDGVRQPTAAFPNLLESIVIRDNIAYIPNTCASPNGPFRFNVNVQSCLSTIDTSHRRGSVPDPEHERRASRSSRSAPGCSTPTRSRSRSSVGAPKGFVTLGATNRLLRVTLNDAGQPTINPPTAPGDPGGIVRIELKAPDEIGVADPNDAIGGKNPRGIVFNSTDTRAYVMDFVSRDIVVGRHLGRQSGAVHDACPNPLGQPAGGRHDRGDRPARQAAVQYLDRTRGHAGQLQASGRTDVGLRLGHLLQLPPERADRHRHLDVPGWPAPGDLDGEHLRRRRRGDRQRRAAAARVASARAELVGGARRAAGFRAEHPRGLGRRRA